MSGIPLVFPSMRSLLQIVALTTLSLSLGVAGALAPENDPSLVERAVDSWVLGYDVSSSDGKIDWDEIASNHFTSGGKFAYIRATEGSS